jgi:hypothetical protein
VSLVSSDNPSNVGQAVTFTATVSGNAGAATGTVAFMDATSALAGCEAVAVSSGVAACTTSSLSAGAHSISATYSGDAHYNTASSQALTQTVNSASSSPATIISPANGSTLPGSTVTFTWNDAGASLYQVWVGNSVGAYDVGYFPTAGTSATSTTVSGLPTDGRKLYVRLWSNIGGTYYFTDSTYIAVRD